MPRRPEIQIDEIAAVDGEERLYVRARYWPDAAAAAAGEPAAGEEDFLLLPLPATRVVPARGRANSLITRGGAEITEAAFRAAAEAGNAPELRMTTIPVNRGDELRRIIERWVDSHEASQQTSRPISRRTAGRPPPRNADDPLELIDADLEDLRDARVPHRNERPDGPIRPPRPASPPGRPDPPASPPGRPGAIP